MSPIAITGVSQMLLCSGRLVFFLYIYKVDLGSLPLTTEALSVHIASCRETCRSGKVVFKLISLVLAVSRFTMLESSVICYCTSAACGLIKPLLHTHSCRYKPSHSNPSSGSAKLMEKKLFPSGFKMHVPSCYNFIHVGFIWF